MAISDQIDAVESGGDPTATNPNSSASSAHMFNEFRANPRISKLLFSGSPTTIGGLVVSLTVDTINRMTLARALSHVREKIFKAISPSVADLNSSRAIQAIRSMIFIFASLNHAAPNVIFSRRLFASRNRDAHAVRAINGPSAFFRIATTACGILGHKIVCSHDLFGSAFASTEKLAHPRIAIRSDYWWRFGDNKKAPEFHSDIILAGAHR